MKIEQACDLESEMKTTRGMRKGASFPPASQLCRSLSRGSVLLQEASGAGAVRPEPRRGGGLRHMHQTFQE